MKVTIKATAEKGNQLVAINITTEGACPSFSISEAVDKANPRYLTALIKPGGSISRVAATYTYTRKPTTERLWVLQDALAELAQSIVDYNAHLEASMPEVNIHGEVEG